MREMQTKHNNGATQQAQYDFSVSPSHLQALSDWFVRLLGNKYAIPLDKIREKDDSLTVATHCVFFTHNEKHEDENPSAWIKVFLQKGQLASGCSKCGRAQVVSHNGEWQPAPTLQTLSRLDERLRNTLLDLGCKEFPLTVEEAKALEVELPERERQKRQPRVGFPVVYADGSEGFHFRVAVEGKDKWRHMEGGKAGEAVFGLHHEKVKEKIQSQGFVIITESPFDAAVLIAAGFPAIGCCGKKNVKALGCDLHRETLLSLLGDNSVVYVWREHDAPETPILVANALQRPVKVISPPVTEEEDPKALKDPFRILLACGKDWNAFKAEIDRLIANATEVVAPQPTTQIIPFGATERKIVSLRQILDEAEWRPLREITMPKNTRWQVEGLIKEGNLVILSARPKTSKSIIALNLAACVAMGKPFLDRSVTQGRALYVAYERHELTLQRALTMGLADCYDFSLWDKAKYKLPAVDCLDGWVGFIERHGVKLVVFDTLVQFLRPALAKERNGINAYDFVYGVLTEIQNAAGETGCTFVLIHHDRKGEKGEIDEAQLLGSTALSASPDIILQLKPMGKKVICMKASGNEIEETTLYFRVGENYWLELTDKPAMTKEEEAARVIEDYLRQRGEATRQDLIRLLVEKGLAKASSAPVLLQRAFEDYLVYKIEKRNEGKHMVYRLIGESNRPSLPPAQPEQAPKMTFEVLGDQPDDDSPTPPDLQGSPTEPERPDPTDSPQQTRPVTGKENVTVVIRQPDQPEPTSNMCNTNNTSNNEYHVTGVTGQSEPDPQPERRITTVTFPIGVMGLCNDLLGSPPTQSDQDLQATVEVWDYDKVYGDQPDDNPPESPEPKRPTDQHDSPDQPETDMQATSDDQQPDPLWLVFDGVFPELVVVSPPEHAGRPNQTESDQRERPDQSEIRIEFIRINSISLPSQPEPEQPEGRPTPPELPANEPVAILTEPICPFCGEILDPDPDSGLAACLGCGRLFKVEPESDEDEFPPDSPDDDDGNPPDSPDGNGSSPPNNGHGGSKTGFAPPKTLSIPPAFLTGNRIYSNKFNSPAILNRMTVRLPDRSIKLVWDDTTETVAPDELAGWQPIETIPDIDLPDIESVEIPPVVVLDLETTDKDPQRGRILAAGLALYVKGNEEKVRIIRNEGDEAALLEQVFDWLRQTYTDLGEFILTGYNIFDFDLTFLIERARKLRVKCPFRFKEDDNGKIVRWQVAATEGTLKGDKIDYPEIVAPNLPIRIVDTLHLVCRWDYTAKQLRHYDLKSVAAHFGVNQPDRPILSPAQIRHAFEHDPATFEAYLLADLRETYAVFAKLIPPYTGIAALTGLPLDLIVVKSTAWIWEKILERYYDETPQHDEKRKYKGGLVVSRRGLWSPCLKIDIASLYPTIMLAYRIHSRKDPAQYALRWLKTLTEQRLALKAKAKAGDANAQILQEAMKILINSLYGFYGTERYSFNDMTAAAKVTEIGRKVLTAMIAAIEDKGGIVVEADTDGIIVYYRNADPQEILEAVTAAIPEVFKVEVEWQEAVVFVSDDKNYVVLDANGDLIAVKGSKWRGRDKEAYQTQAIPTFVRIWATVGKEAALKYARQVLDEIRSGNGWRWVVRTHRVGKGDKFLIEAGFEVGEIATYAYKDKKRKIVAKEETEGYDCNYYAGEFNDLVKEVIAAIDPAQIAAWERMVGREARPLIFR